MPKDALLIVDVQNDICPGGTLPIPEGDKVVKPINRLIEHFKKNRRPILASRDWHPPITNHFKAYGGKWPVHCVHNTWGAKFHSGLELPEEVIIVSKGMYKDQDAYSAFQGTLQVTSWGATTLKDLLDNHGVERIYVVGLATDYCVKSTVLDALHLGYKVVVIEDAIRGVAPETTEQAIKEMKEAGAVFAATDDVLGNTTPPYE